MPAVTAALAFTLSAALVLLTSWLLAAAARDVAEKFWLFLAAALVQLGVITTILSLFQALTPAATLAVQLALLVLATLIRFTTRRTQSATTSKQSLLANRIALLIA